VGVRVGMYSMLLFNRTNHVAKKKVQGKYMKPDFTQFLFIIMTEAVKVFGYFNGFPMMQ
jgi:hypothetical protein